MRHHVQLAAREREAEQRAQWAKNAERNAALWAASIPADDAVLSYLAARGLAQWTLPACIRQHPGLAYWHADDNGELHMLGRYPAMLAPSCLAASCWLSTAPTWAKAARLMCPHPRS
jgi:hypothetical protein